MTKKFADSSVLHASARALSPSRPDSNPFRRFIPGFYRTPDYPDARHIASQVRRNGATKGGERAVLNACAFAGTVFAGTLRYDGRTPTKAHSLEVGYLAALAGFSEKNVIAGILHDVIEDRAVSIGQLIQLFGPEVAYKVAMLTKPLLYVPEGRWVAPFEQEYYSGKCVKGGRQLYDEKTEVYYSGLLNSGDLALLALKFFDSLVNLRSISSLPHWKRERNVGTMVRHLLEVGAKIMPPELFGEFVKLLEKEGFEVRKLIPDVLSVPLDPVVVLPNRSRVNLLAISLFRPPSESSLHASLYLPGRDGVFEIGLPPVIFELGSHELNSAILRVFNGRNFETRFGTSLLPEGLAGREAIIQVKPLSHGFGVLDVMKSFARKLLVALGRPIYGTSSIL